MTTKNAWEQLKQTFILRKKERIDGFEKTSINTA